MALSFQKLTKNLPVVSFRSSGEKILNVFYQEKCADEQEERNRIVQAAASIILEDIRSKVYEKQEYPPYDDFLIV